MALRKKKEKEKKKEFRSARARNGAIRREVRALARRHRCICFLCLPMCSARPSKSQAADLPTRRGKSGGKTPAPGFRPGRRSARAGALCRFARFSADSAISRRRRASGRSTPIDAPESVSDRIFGRRKCRGGPPYPPPLSPPAPVRSRRRAIPRARVPIGSWRDAAVRARATRERARASFFAVGISRACEPRKTQRASARAERRRLAGGRVGERSAALACSRAPRGGQAGGRTGVPPRLRPASAA